MMAGFRQLTDEEAEVTVYKGATVMTLFRGRWNSLNRQREQSERIKELEALLEEAIVVVGHSSLTSAWEDALKRPVI